MKKYLLLLAFLGSINAHAYDWGAAFNQYQGQWLGVHWSVLQPHEQNGSSSAFIYGNAYFTDVNCPSQSRPLIYHPEEITWYWFTCPGSNRGVSSHGFILNGERLSLGQKFITRVF